MKRIVRQPGRCVRWHRLAGALLLCFQAEAMALPVASSGAEAVVAARVPAGRQGGGFRLDPRSRQPVLEYRQTIPMLSGFSTRPTVQVFADGTVRVHRPVYMKQAGDYQYRLTATELVSLLRALVDDGLAVLDGNTARAEKARLDQQARQRGELHVVSDTMESEVILRLRDFQPDRRSAVVPLLEKRLVWKNLENDARRYPGVAGIQALSRSMSRLETLKRDARMRPAP